MWPNPGTRQERVADLSARQLETRYPDRLEKGLISSSAVMFRAKPVVQAFQRGIRAES